MEALRETYLIALHDLRHSIRTTKALAFLIIYALLSVCSGGFVIWSAAKVNTAIEQQATTMGVTGDTLESGKTELYQRFVEGVVGDKDQAAYYLSIPLIILFFFWASRLFLPWLIALMTYDQIAGEIQHRSARYTLIRARRGALLVGKLGANMTLIVGLTVVTNLVLVAVALWQIPGFDVGAAFYHLLRFWLLILPLCLAWLCLVALVSTMTRVPYVAMMFSLGLLLVTGVLNLLCSVSETLAPLRYALPWHYGGYLLSDQSSKQLTGAAALLGFALLFGAAAYLNLRRRDL